MEKEKKEILNKYDIQKFLQTDSVINDQSKIFPLYMIYQKITKLEKSGASLNELERKAYTLNNRTLSNKERICLEIKRIKYKIKETKPDRDMIRTIIFLDNLSKKDIYNDKSIVNYIKKEIVKLQALLNLNITFFSAAKEAFIEENLKINLEDYISKDTEKEVYKNVIRK